MIEQKTFNNRYRLDRKLGEGGMAVVYCGTDTLLRRHVAVKVLREQYAADAEFVRRFYQEAESAARLSHPNIVNTYDVGCEGDVYYIVMELVDGPSLAEIIATDGKLPEPVAIDYAAQICNGLAYAHRQGLLHRDVKPANILVTKDDVVKLSDFGIARAVSQQTMAMTQPGLVMGSIYYISPEQAQGHELRETSDIYSVGIVLYQMLTGALPYTGESPVAVALRHIGDPVPVLDTKTLGVSPALAAIVNRLLQKHPEHRFSSASAVSSALREARERPSVAAFHITDDAPVRSAQSEAPPLPPRRSPLPDRQYTSLSEEEERRSRVGSRMIAGLIALLVLTTLAGYVLFGRTLPHFTQDIAVADYTGMSDTQAQQEIVNAGLAARVIKTPSDTVAENHVIRQTPGAGATIEKNAVVELFVSNGSPLVGLRDVRGYLAGDAQRTLQDDTFKVRLAHKFDNAPKDSVIDQDPKPGAPVRHGASILLVVSNGPQSVQVPNFVGMRTDAALALAHRLGVTLDTTQRMSVSGVADDTIAQQDVASGSQADRTTVVHAIVSTGSPNLAGATAVSVPDVATRAYAEAISQLTSQGFRVAVGFSVQNTANGTVIAQDPAAGTQRPSGSTVSVTLSVPGEVPDTEGLTIDQARTTLEAAGYTIGTITYTTLEGASGKVVRSQPEAGDAHPPGSSVTLVVNGAHP